MTNEHDSTMTVADMALIRQAILTVIDDGDNGQPWELYEANGLIAISEDEANEQRLAFCDAVQARLVGRLAPAVTGPKWMLQHRTLTNPLRYWNANKSKWDELGDATIYDDLERRKSLLAGQWVQVNRQPPWGDDEKGWQ